MRRGLRRLAVGLTAVGTLAFGLSGPAAAMAADDGDGPVASPPTTPAVQSVSGVATNGVQVSMTLPKQLPADLPGRQLPGREVDVTVKDTAGQGYTGSADTTLTAEGGGVTHLALRIERYDPDSGSWKSVPVPPSAGASWTVSVPVTVPAGGSQTVRLRMSPGTTVVDDVKVSATANGATAVATTPVTEPTFHVGGLTGAVRAGTPVVVTGRLANPTDVDYRHVPVKLSLKACSSQLGKCFGAADVKLEAQVGGGWQTVPATDDPSVAGGVSGTLFPDLTLDHGDAAQVNARVTLNSGAATVNPVSLSFGPVGLTVAEPDGTDGTLTVQPVVPSPTPSSTSSSSASATSSSSDPSATPSTSESSPTATEPSSTAATPSATPAAPDTKPVGASTPGSSGSSSATLLVAVGLLAVCLALVLSWVLMKRRERQRQGNGLDQAQDLEQVQE